MSQDSSSRVRVSTPLIILFGFVTFAFGAVPPMIPNQQLSDVQKMLWNLLFSPTCIVAGVAGICKTVASEIKEAEDKTREQLEASLRDEAFKAQDQRIDNFQADLKQELITLRKEISSLGITEDVQAKILDQFNQLEAANRRLDSRLKVSKSILDKLTKEKQQALIKKAVTEGRLNRAIAQKTLLAFETDLAQCLHWFLCSIKRLKQFPIEPDRYISAISMLPEKFNHYQTALTVLKEELLAQDFRGDATIVEEYIDCLLQELENSSKIQTQIAA